MAVLNIANQFDPTLTGIDNYLNRTANSKELIFTRDRHIITHGIDFLQDYLDGSRGLVPDYKLESQYGVLGRNGWSVITTEMLPIATDLTTNLDNSTIPTSKAVKDFLQIFVDQEILAAETMRFMGVIGFLNGQIYHYLVGETQPTTANGFPKKANIGDSYRIAEAGSLLGGKAVEPGDMIICKKAYNNEDSDTNNDAVSPNDSIYWFIIQTNINGTIQVKAGGKTVSVYSNSTQDITIYSPDNAGEDGKILFSTGTDTPTWKSLGLNFNNGIISLAPNTNANIEIKKLNFGTGLQTNVNNITSYNGSQELTLTVNRVNKGVAGIVPEIPTTVEAMNDVEWLLTTNSDGNTSWKLWSKVQASENTWRDIQIGGNTIGSKTLNFVTAPLGSIGIVANNGDIDGTTTDTYDIGFDIYWFDLDNNTYEIN